MTLAHGTCVEIDGAAVLLRGASGSGKSDLALRLIDAAGARLVADDQVELRARQGALVASAPAAIAGRIEVRGVGILEVASVSEACVVLVADLVPPEMIERLPEPDEVEIANVRLPLIRIAPFEASAIAKLRFALRHFGPYLRAVG